MKDLPLRIGQLITSFGPGSLVVNPEGESAMVGSLDKWYYDKNEFPIKELDEYEIHEPRLRSILNVDKLLQPPDYRAGYKYKNAGSAFQQTNTDIYIPLLRFPTWHYCPICKTLNQSEMSKRTSWLYCKECKNQRKMIQVPFVMVCKNGHLSDFPWREWIHKDENTTCEGEMSLISTGGATLDSLKVKCECNKERSLRGVMTRKMNESDEEEEGISELSKMLNENGEIYQCPGHKPWHGSLEEKEKCSCYPVAVLKNSINVYYPKTISAIYLPGENQSVEALINMFERSGVTTSLLNITDRISQKIEMVKKMCPPEVLDYNDEDIELALLYMEKGGERTKEIIGSKNTEKELRKKEFKVLVQGVETDNLKVREEWESNQVESSDITTYFNLINRVTKLKETIALIGFNRLSINNEVTMADQVANGKKLLFRNSNSSKNNWLPAYKVFGEGIFFTLNTEALRIWEQKKEVLMYFERLQTRVKKKKGIYIDESIIKPKNVLLHTLSHIIIDELALTCGYNASSIRERIYIDDEQSGVLIYTSSGDIDGTLGGLVRMGKKENFFPVVYQAIERARWCSSDPVCSEIGKTAGQGINNLNGAACHSCSYLPETSCELGNLLLDRTLLIDPEIGFFNESKI